MPRSVDKSPDLGPPVTMDSRTIIRDLQRPEAFPHRPEEIGFLQTHISLLFFAGAKVYKVKKAVDLGFLDFTTLEKRRHFCEEELRLNRRLAPRVYVGLAGLVLGPDGHLRVGSADGEDGEVVEWAVEMVRLPAHRMLSELLDRGEVDNEQMRHIASTLADFHAACPTGEGIDSFGTPASLRALVDENLAQLEPMVGPLPSANAERPATPLGVLTPRQHAYLRDRRAAFFQAHEDSLRHRVAEGHIRDGHGDLHCGNLCLTDGEVVAYDCIEFSARFRCGDVAADLAFLAMDLDLRGYPGFSAFLVKHYAELTGDPDLRLLVDFYKSYRAVVRGKVAALTATDPNVDTARRAELRSEAQRYLMLATGYELPPVLVLMCGLPASGKSVLARRLARPLRAPVYQSDVRRKVARGLAPTESQARAYGEGLYSQESKRETYDSLLASAEEALAAGRSAIVDASFSMRAFRDPFVEAARRAGVPHMMVHVWTSAEESRARLRRRAASGKDASDAGLEVYKAARTAFQCPNELAPHHLVEIASEVGTLEDQCSAVVDALIAVTAEY